MAGGFTMERDVEVPMRDGTILRADIYRPLGAGPFPALLMRTPYDKSGGMDIGGGPDERRATAAGYVMVRMDVRGRYRSDGEFVPFEHEADDGYDTVEWVAAQPWCNGNVGMIGGSYVGYTQWSTATRRPPHLRAIAPVVATSDLHDFWIYEGGAPSLWFNMSWMFAALGPDITMRRYPGDADRLARAITRHRRAGRPSPPHPGRHRSRSWSSGWDDLYRTWVEHPERDDVLAGAVAARGVGRDRGAQPQHRRLVRLLRRRLAGNYTGMTGDRRQRRGPRRHAADRGAVAPRVPAAGRSGGRLRVRDRLRAARHRHGGHPAALLRPLGEGHPGRERRGRAGEAVRDGHRRLA